MTDVANRWPKEDHKGFCADCNERKWISVQERLPREGEDVLFWNSKYIFTGYLQNVTCEDEIIDRVFWCNSDEDSDLVSLQYPPTHWKPLEEPPND